MLDAACPISHCAHLQVCDIGPPQTAELAFGVSDRKEHAE